MTSVDPAPDASPDTTRIEALEIAGVRLIGLLVLSWGVIDSIYVLARFLFVGTYPDDFAYLAWVLAEAFVGWRLATRAPRIARWLRARTRVDLPA